jgi:hypothetical protein
MKPGSETWKWALVFILLAVFLITANQAYVHVSTQEDFPPPDDYLKGDSWDLEHQGGPGAGQAMQLPPELQENDSGTNVIDDDQTQDSEAVPRLMHEEEIDWNQVPIPAGD